MSYQHIIAARQRLHAMGVPHLDLGGALGGAGIGSLVMGPMGALPGAFAGSGGSGIQGGIDALGNAASNVVPTNHYQATTPQIAQTNFQPGEQQAMGDYTYGQGALHSSVDRQNFSGEQQAGAAGAIGGDAANVSGLAQGPNGLGGVLGQQQSLGQALAAQAAGQGPNPAQSQFQQNTNQNISQEAGAIASAKGINPALAARMAAENAGQQQQGMAANAATLQAQQQLGAESQLGQTLAQQGQTVMGQGSLYSTAGGLHGAQASAYGGAGQTFQGAGNTAAQATGQANQLYGTNVGGQNAQNNTITSGSLGAQGIDAGVAANNTTTKGQLLGGVLNGAGGVAAAGLAKGGVVGVDGKAMSLAQALMAQGGQVPGHAAHPGNDPRNDVVPAVLSRGEVVLPNTVTQGPDAAQKAAAFMEHLKGKAEPGYGKVLEARRKLAEAHAAYCQGGAA